MLAGGLEDRISGVRDEGKTWEQEERAAEVTTTSLPPPQTFLNLTVYSCSASSTEQPGSLRTPFTIRTQVSLRHKEEWAGIGGEMEKQKH